MFYLHVGLHYGAPFRPTFSVLVEVDSAVADARGRDYVLLKDCCTWLTAVRLADSLKQSDTWCCQLYRLEDTPRVIAKMDAGVVSALKDSSEAVQIWPRAYMPRGGGGGGRGGRRRRPAPALDDGDDGSGGDESDDGWGSDPGDAPEPPPADDPPPPAEIDSDPELQDDIDADNAQADRDVGYMELLDATMALFENDAIAAAEAPTADPEGAPAGASSSGCGSIPNFKKPHSVL